MSALLRVTVAGRNDVVAARCALADGMVSRLVGLLNRDRLESDEGLLLDPCNNVHTFFMRFAIDAVFLAKDDVVLGVYGLAPWRVSPLKWRARKVLELPLGTCRKVGLKTGDRLEFTPCSN